MRFLSRFTVGLVLLLLAGELFARFGLGLGTPPISVIHPTVEYMFVPNQDVMRFGNRQLYNELSMRSIAISQIHQPNKILVLGDSVVNGGNITDHAKLATSIATDSEHFFGNVSAGSWGPANLGAWIDLNGYLGADRAIAVLSSHDLTDVPDFASLDPNTHPTKMPLSALIEGIQRYLPRYLPSFMSNLSQKSSPTITENTEGSVSAEAAWRGTEEIEALIDRFANASIKLCLIQHQTMAELDTAPDPNHFVIQNIFNKRNVPTIDFGPILEAARSQGASVYSDNIHLADQGQALLAPQLKECARAASIPLIRVER